MHSLWCSHNIASSLHGRVVLVYMQSSCFQCMELSWGPFALHIAGRLLVCIRLYMFVTCGIWKNRTEKRFYHVMLSHECAQRATGTEICNICVMHARHQDMSDVLWDKVQDRCDARRNYLFVRCFVGHLSVGSFLIFVGEILGQTDFVSWYDWAFSHSSMIFRFQENRPAQHAARILYLSESMCKHVLFWPKPTACKKTQRATQLVWLGPRSQHKMCALPHQHQIQDSFWIQFRQSIACERNRCVCLNIGNRLRAHRLLLKFNQLFSLLGSSSLWKKFLGFWLGTANKTITQTELLHVIQRGTFSRN